MHESGSYRSRAKGGYVPALQTENSRKIIIAYDNTDYHRLLNGNLGNLRNSIIML